MYQVWNVWHLDGELVECWPMVLEALLLSAFFSGAQPRVSFVQGDIRQVYQMPSKNVSQQHQPFGEPVCQ